MRAAALPCLAALLLGASGCSLGANEDLKRVVEAAFPPGMESSTDNCEWGVSTYEHEPKSWYGCWGYSSGDFVRVAATIAAQLSRRDFAVTASRNGRTVELTGVLGANTVCVDVLGSGFSYGRNTSPSRSGSARAMSSSTSGVLSVAAPAAPPALTFLPGRTNQAPFLARNTRPGRGSRRL